MTTIRKTALVPYSPAEMFALVKDVDSYPKFLPWCTDARVVARHGDELRAMVAFAKGGVHKSFTTSNRHDEPNLIDIRLVEGPFKHLEGFWRFDRLGEDGCKVTLDLEFEFGSRVLSLVVGPVFHQIASTLVDSFQQRAVQVYGRR